MQVVEEELNMMQQVEQVEQVEEEQEVVVSKYSSYFRNSKYRRRRWR
jgi:hypothetical protein